MVNTAALAAAAALTGFPLRYMEDVIRENFAKKGAELAEANLRVAAESYKAAQARFSDDFTFRIRPPERPTQRMLMNGNEAIALGALAGGCRFMAAYPMTPATTIIEWLSALPPEYGMVTKHAEDEIAAACMALGASFAGARAMTATSGGGFCLMVETIGLAGMTEVPLVIVEAQRGGPSTGLPTRAEQSDLLFAVHASQGEFPRIVTSPGTVEECFEAGWRAFNLAEKYQCPVVVMTDQFMASSLRTVDPDAIDFSQVQIDRGKTLVAQDMERLENGYKRFQLTADGISPRAVPGHPRAVVRASSDEHSEEGHIMEEPDNRVRMMRKRMGKERLADQEIKPPILYGPEEADVTLVCWGSTYGPCREAADKANAAGGSVNVLRFVDLWPLPMEAVRRAVLACKTTIAVEQNYTSQLAKLVRMATGVSVDRTLNRFDGRPFSPGQILAALEEEVSSGHKA